MEEQWSSARGGVLLGFSRTLRGDSVITYEQLRITHAADTLIYHAYPRGQPPAEFRTAEPQPDGTIVFENPHHDFPQRIRYRTVGPDSLIARIEGTRGGQARGIEYPYRRAPCPGGSTQNRD